jgi:pyruvate dehydrogenase E1 component alpha subunit
MAELYAKATGYCGGKGGSMHIADLEKGMMGANGIVGGGPPLICGAALTAKVMKTGGVAVAFLGDGASNQGTTLESYNLAAVWKLPAVFVVEDNGYAESTASAYAVAGSQVERARGFGMPAEEVDGYDFFAVHDAAGTAIQRARAGEGPSLIHVRFTRYYGHFEGDGMTYRGPGEVDRVRAERDCIKRFRARVIEAALLETDELDSIDRSVAEDVRTAVRNAKDAPRPGDAELLTDVYVAY